MTYTPSETRYDNLPYKRCGRSGLMLPEISLGLWHNWGDSDDFENGRKMIQRAFDMGITHFDLANNYGPPPGSAERNFGKILKADLMSHRDELVISTKAGFEMWPGPYGDHGSRKYLVASIDQSLQRMGLDYVDIFYHHRPDTKTPLEETMGALDYIVRSGKALYAGISSYDADRTREASGILKKLGTPCLIHQPRYSMFDRWIEGNLLDVLEDEGIGCIVFSPLAQGLLTDKYLQGIPVGSRADRETGFLQPEHVSTEKVEKARELNEIAKGRNQTLAQMAVVWTLRQEAVTSALIGASKVKQIEEIIKGLANKEFSKEETVRIEGVLGK